MDNPEAHYLTTGPEIWEDTDGKLDYFVAGMGTGGTVSGVGRYLKERAREAGREVKVVCPDPEGSIYQDSFYKRPLRDPRMYKVEGIGHDWMVGTLDFSVIDEVRTVGDRDAFLMARRLARSEGIFSGGSTGVIIHGALQLAREAGPGKLIVAIICDSGDRYISKCFNDSWMKDMGFLDLDERLGTVGDLLSFKGRHVEYAKAEEPIGSVAQRMSDLGISQMPILSAEGTATMMVHEVDLLQSLVSGKCRANDPVVYVGQEMKGKVRLGEPISHLQRIFDQNNVAVVFDCDKALGIISKIDMVKYLASKVG
jgi:cystathionine beta-synthase